MMKRIALILSVILVMGMFAACGNTNTPSNTDVPPATSGSETPINTENSVITEPKAQAQQLSVGTMQVYDFGTVKLHAYGTNDFLGDYCFVLETDTDLIGIEAPAFNDNLSEYNDYIANLNKPMTGILLSSHPTGANTVLYDGVPVYATTAVQAATQSGGSVKALTDSFVDTFGDGFNANIAKITNIIEPGTVTIGGLDFIISDNGDGYDIEIPAINCVYTHMMGSDVHNILSSKEHIDAMIAQMKSYQDKGIYLALTSHYAPETIDKVAVKVAYLEKAKELIDKSESGDKWIAAMQEAFPGYGGENYLEMSAGMLSFE